MHVKADDNTRLAVQRQIAEVFAVDYSTYAHDWCQPQREIQRYKHDKYRDLARAGK